MGDKVRITVEVDEIDLIDAKALVEEGVYATLEEALGIGRPPVPDPRDNAELKALIEEGMADVRAGRLEPYDMAKILAEAREEWSRS